MRISDWSSDVCSSDLLQYGAAKLLDCARRPQPCHIGVQDRLHVHADLLRHAPDLLGDMIEARRRRIGERTHQQRIELLRAGTQGERQIALPGNAPEAVEALGHALDRRGENPPDDVGAEGTYAEYEEGEKIGRANV